MELVSNTGQKAPQSTTNASREAAMNGLAIVGFIALVGAGMWLAIYSARYVPGVVSRLGAAAVSLSSVFNSGNSGNNHLSVVPNSDASSTVSFGNETSSSTTPPATTHPSSGYVAPSAGQETSNTYQIGGTAAAPFTGLPDLAITITQTGYLTSNSPDTFVAASSTIPAGERPAVKFTVKNIGTNVAGSWTFLASIPTSSGFVYQSLPQQALNPGDSIDFTLGFDQPRPGNQTITITANSDHSVAESSYDNNQASVSVVILGS